MLGALFLPRWTEKNVRNTFFEVKIIKKLLFFLKTLTKSIKSLYLPENKKVINSNPKI